MEQILGCSMGGVWLFPLSAAIGLWVCAFFLIIHDVISTKCDPVSAWFLPTKSLGFYFLPRHPCLSLPKSLSHHLTSPLPSLEFRLISFFATISLGLVFSPQHLKSRLTEICSVPLFFNLLFISSVSLAMQSFHRLFILFPEQSSVLSLCVFPPKCIILWLCYIFPFQFELI